jgi:hypothetical protein
MSRTPIFFLVALASLALAASALGSASHSAASKQPSLKVQPGKVRPGGAVHVFGKAGSCAAGSHLTAFSFPFPESASGSGALTGEMGAHHKFSIHGYIRGNVVAGSYSVTAQCNGADLGITAQVRVK